MKYTSITMTMLLLWPLCTTAASIPLVDDPGLAGGLYEPSIYCPGPCNVPPDDHLAAGAAALGRVQFLPGTAGSKAAFMCSGMSNAYQVFGQENQSQHRAAFKLSDEPNRHPNVHFPGGCKTGCSLEYWAQEPNAAGPNGDWACGGAPGGPLYDQVTDVMASQGIDSSQVQAGWAKVATLAPQRHFTSGEEHVVQVARLIAESMRQIKLRYPNVHLFWISSRSSAAWSNHLSPEPFAFQTGQAVRLVVMEQIKQRRGEVTPYTATIGDMLTDMPWLDWGPYLWSAHPDSPCGDRGDGSDSPCSDNVPTTPNAWDGLFYIRANYSSDGTHPSPYFPFPQPDSGESKQADIFLAWSRNNPLVTAFLQGGFTLSSEIPMPPTLLND